jgi:4'-phosphopantetheinyl transferase
MRAGEAGKSMGAKNNNTVLVLYTFSDKRLTELAWERGFCKLPKEIQIKIIRYNRWQDRQARMLGYLMLQKGLRYFGYNIGSLKDVSTDRFGRPYVTDGVDFNISHSDDRVICAVTCHGRIGIDIEKIKLIDISGFENYMSLDQLKKIKESENMYETFYDIWTIKESTLKADGRGLSVPLEQVETRGNKAVLDGRTWFLKKLSVSKDSSCHLASDLESPVIEMKREEFGG